MLHTYLISIPITSTEKYSHHTPWPAFTRPIHPDSLHKELEEEPQESSSNTAYKVSTVSAVSIQCPVPASLLTVLTDIQVSCGKCGNPLGHEFLRDGPGGEGSRF